MTASTTTNDGGAPVKVRLRYFAALREALGPGEEAEVEPGSTVAALRARLCQASRRHAEALAPGRAVRCAVNQVMCGDATVLTDGAEVAFFPPVTGG